MEGIKKSELLGRLGYGGDPAAVAPLLESAGLSRRAKARIHPGKAEAIRRLLAQYFILVCGRGDCRARAETSRGSRRIVPASAPKHCAICGGSVIQAAVDTMVAACERVGWRRLLVVGGSPNTRIQIEEAVADRLDLRLIDGTVSRNRKAATADLAWADHVVIWGTTQLAHKVSLLYSRDEKASAVNRRGVEELARHVARMAAQRTHPRRVVGRIAGNE